MPSPRPRTVAVTSRITRGTTNPNRLRRVDRWLAGPCSDALNGAIDPLVVDLGYGASPVTTRELYDRLAAVRPDAEVVGIEIDPVRVADAQPYTLDRLSFRHGGFELPLDGRRPVLIRAMNVLRQYDESQVAGAWQQLLGRLAPGGLLVEGTCDELGRLAGWVTLDPTGPRTLTLAAHLRSLERPAALAERLPKALIHRNIAGEPVHALLRALDRAWDVAAPYAAFGPRQRWSEAVRLLARAASRSCTGRPDGGSASSPFRGRRSHRGPGERRWQTRGHDRTISGRRPVGSAAGRERPHACRAQR
jgi:SAM-dependent methyltransferase